MRDIEELRDNTRLSKGIANLGQYLIDNAKEIAGTFIIVENGFMLDIHYDGLHYPSIRIGQEIFPCGFKKPEAENQKQGGL